MRETHDEDAPMPRRLRGVVFDLDDTLVESTVNYGKFKALVIERIASYGDDGAHYSPTETIVSILGRHEARLREKGAGEAEIRRRLAEMDRIMDSVELEHVDDTRVMPGAEELLRFLRSKGLKVGVLTRGCAEYAERALRNTDLTGLVDALECRNSETKPKPDPEAYLKLVSALGVWKDETVFVGDHPIDAKCAEAARVGFLGVQTGSAPEDSLRESKAIEVFPGLQQLTLWLKNVIG
jgi:HAD superfamily hydrolase (TIGR01549 family)